LDYLKNKARFKNLAVLELRFRSIYWESGLKIGPPTDIRLKEERQRAAKDISLKLETQVCTTNPDEVPPGKAEFFSNSR